LAVGAYWLSGRRDPRGGGGAAADASGSLLRGTTAVAATLTEAIVQTVVAIMTLFFLLRDGPVILAHIRANSPLAED